MTNPDRDRERLAKTLSEYHLSPKDKDDEFLLPPTINTNFYAAWVVYIQLGIRLKYIYHGLTVCNNNIADTLEYLLYDRIPINSQ